MTRPVWQILKADELARCRDEVNQENRLAIRLLGMVGLPLAVANMVVQMTLSSDTEVLPFFLRTSWVLLYFLALLAVERWAIPEDYPHATALLYAVEAPVLICSILLGSVWDPDHLAFTFFIFLMATPMFVLDRPWRVMLVTTGWTALFVIACLAVKPPDIFERDFLHAFEFWLAAIAVANVVIRVRIVALERLELVHAYETNALTGLPSMLSFISRANDAMQTVVNKSREPVIGFIALPGIKAYNNEFGYTKGDDLIRRTAELLQEAFPDRLLCSITGSQFGIMVYKSEIDDGLQFVSSRLAEYGDEHYVICRAGFAEYADGETAISLLDKAQIAEKGIRPDSRELYRFYDEQLDADMKLREHIITHLDEAIERGYLEVYYQPIVRTSTREICDEEALSRWNDPERGLLPPCSFIPPLEESRQVYKLSLHVVRQVLADFERKREAGVAIAPVSVNLSRHDFEQCDMVRAISELVDESDFSRDMLRIEITESAFTENQELLKREIARFRTAGFQVWLDDFGSEYSTLNLLQDLDFDLIKIDMEFMRHSEDSVKNLIIVSSIIDMAKKMGVATLVEGVETEDHMGILRAMGCDKMQGFYFSKPRPLQEVIDRVTEGAARPFEGQDGYGHR